MGKSCPKMKKIIQKANELDKIERYVIFKC